jgi:NAD(P)-dependent dehydrogenase (short-subunit alcohol dehydrogenase family)
LRFPWLILSSKIEVHGKPKSLFNDGPLFQGQARSGTVEEIAAMARLLAGPQGGYITGQCIHINGGTYLGH